MGTSRRWHFVLPLTALALLEPGRAAAQDPSAPPAAELVAAPPGDHFDAVLVPGGDTLRYSLYVPPGIGEEEARVPLVVALHPGGMAAPWIGGAYLYQLVKPALEETGAVMVAPDALTVPDAPYRAESFTSPRNLEAVLWLTRKLMELYPVDPSRVVVTGYSRGGQGVWYMALHHPELFSAAIAVSSRPEDDAVAGVGIPMYLIHSLDDEVIGVVWTQAAYQQMVERGADVQIQIVKGPTHYQTDAFVPALRGTIPWLQRVWSRTVR